MLHFFKFARTTSTRMGSTLATRSFATNNEDPSNGTIALGGLKTHFLVENHHYSLMFNQRYTTTRQQIIHDQVFGCFIPRTKSMGKISAYDPYMHPLIEFNLPKFAPALLPKYTYPVTRQSVFGHELTFNCHVQFSPQSMYDIDAAIYFRLEPKRYSCTIDLIETHPALTATSRAHALVSSAMLMGLLQGCSSFTLHENIDPALVAGMGFTSQEGRMCLDFNQLSNESYQKFMSAVSPAVRHQLSMVLPDELTTRYKP